MGADHPECTQRLQAINDRLVSTGLFDLLRHYEAPAVTHEQLLRVHDEAYLRHIKALAPSEGRVMLDPDTWMNTHTLKAAEHAAGAAVLATDLVMAGDVNNAFCAVRPPGHHAEHNRAMGFCFYNNVAVAAAHALERHGLQRIAIVDFDVHHGNGTEDIFLNDSRVLFCSSFQHPFYPNSPLAERNEHIIHAPLHAGDGSNEFRASIREKCLPALEKFAPEMIFISAGFDAHVEDELSSLQLVDDDYAWVTETIMDLAARHARGRIVSVLEGGYHLDALARSAMVHIKALMQGPTL